jgi:predicted MFS family arabinose efflux permease
MQPDVTNKLPATFNRLAWSNLAAQSAEQIALAAAPIIAVLSLGAGAGATGFLTAAQTLPFLLLSLPAGVLVDRVSRRGVMVSAEVLRVVALLALPLLVWLDLLSVAVLGLIGFAAAAGTVAFSVAAPALVPALVPRGALVTANGRLELARSTAYAAGPAVAGALVAWTGASPAFIIAAILSAWAVLLLRRIPEPPRAELPPRHVMRELRDGASFVWRHALLQPILWTAVVWNLSWFVLQAAYVPYAAHVLGLDATGIGITLATYGIGLVVGALAASRLIRHLSFGASIALGPVASVFAAASMLATIATPSPVLAALSLFLFGAGPIVWVISTTSLRQTVTPDGMLGRVSALFMTANTGARPIGAAIGGVIGAFAGPTACIVVAAIGFVLQAVIIVVSRASRLERLDDAR